MVDIAEVGVKDRSVEVHLFELEYIFSVVSEWLYLIELGLLLWRQVRIRVVVFRLLCLATLNKALLEFNFVHVGDDLDAHGALAFRQIQMLSIFECLDYRRYLGDAVAEDCRLLDEASLVSLAIISFRKAKGSDTGEKRQQYFVVVSGKFLVRSQVHAELHLLEGALEV
jgi:hypothetical protein